MRRVASHLAWRKVKGIYRLVEWIEELKFAAFLEKRGAGLSIKVRRSFMRVLPFSLYQFKVPAQQQPEIGLARIYETAKGQVFFIQFQTA